MEELAVGDRVRHLDWDAGPVALRGRVEAVYDGGMIAVIWDGNDGHSVWHKRYLVRDTAPASFAGPMVAPGTVRYEVTTGSAHDMFGVPFEAPGGDTISNYIAGTAGTVKDGKSVGWGKGGG